MTISTSRQHLKATPSVVRMTLLALLVFCDCCDTNAYEKVVPPTIYLSPNGDDSNSGTSLEEPLRSANAVVSKATPGTRIQFLAGNYSPMKFVELKGTRASPITIEPVQDAAEQQVVLTSGRQQAGVGLTLEKCDYVVARGFRVTNSLKGIDIKSCSNCVIRDNVIDQLGQEAIHVGRLHTYDGTNQFLGPASEHVQVIGNMVSGTGKHKPVYGEGIYVGTGAFRGDDTHDILLEGNTLTDISAEGIEIKPGASSVTVRGNRISNTHHEYNAAITVAIEGSESPNGKYLIENNLIWDIKKVKHGVAGISIGHGNAIIRNNVIWNIEGGIGVRVYQTFANPDALTITMERNTIIAGEGSASILLHNGTGGGSATSLQAKVSMRNNLTDDGSAKSTKATPSMFRGPFLKDADAGRGPGSGFQLRSRLRTGADFSKLLSSRQPGE